MFFLTEFSEFNDKNMSFSKMIEPVPAGHLLCKRPACYHSASMTHVRDGKNSIINVCGLRIDIGTD